ncbi:MAG: aromatic ring-hydroxylating dioxygenase subunit alpha [Actinomycetota bacterium]|nr:aromatic ring-hydroxylating dioxygenase subunit alpha [Actinomycetota bacterium]
MSAIGTRTLPWSWYTDSAVLELEQERIFRRFWQYVGRADELAGPGSFMATQAGHIPVVLVRDEIGVLRAFLNVCRHRGSLVCEGAGRRTTLQCPYHAWTYGLDGSLLAAPRAAREGGIESEELGLVPLRLETWGSFLFVNPDPDAAPLAEFLADVPERVAAAGVDIGALRFLQRSESELAANWKICAENFLECYHCPVAHPGFSAVMDVSRDSYLLETRRWGMSQAGPPRPEPRGGYDLSGEVERGQFHFLFPNTVVNVMPGRPNLSIGPIVPRAPERTYRYLDYFVTPEADAAWVDDMLAFDDEVGAEDRILVERVQQGVRSGLLAEGQLLPESELLVAHFQSLVLDALA